MAQPAADAPMPPSAEAAKAPDAALIDDPRVLTILTTEHWSLLSARSLVYNEMFTRVSMLLSLVAMSFVALALLAQAAGFTREFLLIAVIVFSFDLLVGVASFSRVINANREDFLALHGMARIRHGYTQIAPVVREYFVSPIHDDAESVLSSYSAPANAESGLGAVLYGLSTSLGLIGLTVAVIAGVLGGVVALAIGLSGVVSLVVAVVVGLVAFGLLLRWAFTVAGTIDQLFTPRFPKPSTTEAVLDTEVAQRSK